MTIRKLAVLAVLLATGLMSSPTRALTMSFSGPAIVSAGNVFTWNVLATGVFDGRPGEEVLAFGFDVVIGAPAIVTFLGVSVGPLFDDISALFPDTDVAGLALSTIDETNLVEPLVLASLSFQAIGAGALSLGISSNLGDPNEGLFYLTDVADITANRRLTVGAAAIPGPATSVLIMLALGLMGLLLLSRPS